MMGSQNLHQVVTEVPQLYRVEQTMRMLSLSRTVIYELIRSGRLRSVKEGRTRLISASAIAEYVDRLERETVA